MDARELKRRFGQHVQGLRESVGLTQEQLAERIGRSVDTVSNIERGVNATRIEVAYQIAVAVGVRLPDLFAFEPMPATASPADRLVTTSFRRLIEAADDETATRLLELVRVGLALANRA